MKKLLLAALSMGFALSASAQSGGISISPIGATADQPITITIDPNVVCNDGTPGLGGATIVRLHSGVTIAGQRWQNVVSASPPADGGLPDAITGFTQNANGTWSKTFVPRTYYNVPAGTDITELCFVLNGGPSGTNWDLRGKYEDPATPGSCGDGFASFPVGAPFGVSSVKRGTASAFALSPATPNPISGEATIRFNLKKAGEVNVRVVNLLGETVSVLNNGYMSACAKSFTWNAANAAPGIYFYTVEMDGLAASSKMQVVR